MKKVVAVFFTFIVTSTCFAQSSLDSLIQKHDEQMRRLDSLNQVMDPIIANVQKGLEVMEKASQCSNTLSKLKESTYSISQPFQKLGAQQKLKFQDNMWKYFITPMYISPEEDLQNHAIVSKFVQQNEVYQGTFSITATFPNSDIPQTVNVKSYYAVDKIKPADFSSSFGSIYDLNEVIAKDRKSYHADIFVTPIGQQCVCYSYDDPAMDLRDQFDFFGCTLSDTTPDL
jgi:hypothetical protein